MKIFAIRNEKARKVKNLAYLIYYEKEKVFYIEILDDVQEWELPLMISSFFRKGIRTIDSYYSKLWVKQRIVPSDRQNLGQILKDNNLKNYDEFELLTLSKGRCVQDSYYIYPIFSDNVPAALSDRLNRKIEYAVPIKNNNLIVFFKDGKTRKCDMNSFVLSSDSKTLFLKENIFNMVDILVGGYGVCWGNILSVLSDSLYYMGEPINLNLDDFKSFVLNGVITISEASDLLNCSKQNVCGLIKRNKLQSLNLDNNVFLLKNEVIERNWN